MHAILGMSARPETAYSRYLVIRFGLFDARFLETSGHEFGVDFAVPAGHYTALIFEAVENIYIYIDYGHYG